MVIKSQIWNTRLISSESQPKKVVVVVHVVFVVGLLFLLLLSILVTENLSSKFGQN